MSKKQTFTPKGRLRICSMPVLWGKEWILLKSIAQSLIGIDASFKDFVELERQKLEMKTSQVK